MSHPPPDSGNSNRRFQTNDTPPPPLPPPPQPLDNPLLDFNPPEPVSSNSSTSSNNNRAAGHQSHQSFDPVSSSSLCAPPPVPSSSSGVSDPTVHSLSSFNHPHDQGAEETCFAASGSGGQLDFGRGSFGFGAGLSGDIPLEPQSQADELVSSTTISSNSHQQQSDLFMREPANSSIASSQSPPAPTSFGVNHFAAPESTTTNQPAVSATSSSGPTSSSFTAASPGFKVKSESSAPTSSLTAHPSDPTKFNVNKLLLDQVLEFGFEEYIATLAIQRTGGAGLEQAVNWIFDHSNQSDVEGEEEEQEDISDNNMGASTSRAAAKLFGSEPITTTSSSTLADVIRSIRPPTRRTHKMIFVANMSLKMGVGKLAAQVGHATLGVYRVAQKSPEGMEALNSWRNHGEVKIVVKGQSTEQLLDLFKQAKDSGLYAYLVQDAGYTQIPQAQELC
uniref:peptidyl-tRNA hydrolase n=1 Tax=Ditylenchus dipsaci TaxID=166011 RepID=A0A915EPH4_9BILA